VTRDRKVLTGVVAAVVVVWLVGAAVTRYDVEQMAYLAPVAVLVVGATIGVVLFWVKVVLDALRRQRRPL
jgi:uncharacterized membrane protein